MVSLLTPKRLRHLPSEAHFSGTSNWVAWCGNPCEGERVAMRGCFNTLKVWRKHVLNEDTICMRRCWFHVFFWFFGSHESWCLTLTLPGLHGESFETKNRLTTQPDLLTFSQIISRSWWHNSWVLLMFFSNNHGKLPYWRLRSSSSRALFSTSMLGRVIGWNYTPQTGMQLSPPGSLQFEAVFRMGNFES